MRKLVFIFLFLNWFIGTAQYFQYSMHEFAPSRTNPAYGPLSEYLSGMLIYRNQRMGEGISFNTSHLQVVYPLEFSRVLRASLMLTALDDRFGVAGVYRNNELDAGFALNVNISKNSYLGFGARIGYNHRFVSLNGLTTGSQFIVDRGFFSGNQNEPLGNFDSEFINGDVGLHWQLTNKRLEELVNLGLAVYDVNKPVVSFFNTEDKLKQTWIANSEFRVYNEERLTMYFSGLMISTASVQSTQLGLRSVYEIGNRRDNQQVELLTRYWTQGIVSLGLTYSTEKLRLGCLYDLFIDSRQSVDGFELGVAFRNLITPRKNRSRSNMFHMYRRTMKQNSERDSLTIVSYEQSTEIKSDSSIVVNKEKNNHLVVIYPGQVSEIGPIDLSDTIRFYFPTNKSLIDEEIEGVLSVILEFLESHDQVKLVLTGHTDDVGSSGYNYDLGLKRSEEVADYLLKQGLDWDKIYVESMGEELPLVPNNTEENRAKNRRVDMSFVFD